MHSGSQYVIHDDPACTRQPLNLSPMCYAKISVAVVLTFETVYGSIVARRIQSSRRLRPIHPQKAAGSAHLVAPINRNGIVNGSPASPLFHGGAPL